MYAYKAERWRTSPYISPQQSLFPHDPRSIYPSLHCLRSGFLIVSPPRASFWIASPTMLEGLRLILLPSHSSLHPLDDVVMWRALSNCRICLPVVPNGSFSEQWPFYFGLTLLIHEMSDVARSGPHRGKLPRWCRGWSAESTWTKYNLHFHHHYSGNSNANLTSRRGIYDLLHIWSQGLLETNISRHRFRRRLYHFYHRKKRSRRSCTVIYICKQTHNIRPTWFKLQGGWQPVQRAATHNRIHLVYNEHVGSYAYHFDLKLTIYSSGLPMSFH